MSEKKNFYSTFQTWVIEKYGETVSEENWRDIIEEDNCDSISSNNVAHETDDLITGTSDDQYHNEETQDNTTQDLVYNFV